MNSRTIALLAALLMLSFRVAVATSGDTIRVLSGSEPVVDGVLSPGEWSDAESVQLPDPGFRVYFKHSETDLYIAFADPYGYCRSSGIYVDKQNDKDALPQADDLWLHGSAAQFEWEGNGTSTWQQTTPQGWEYSSNTANEYRISLSKLGIVNADGRTIGLLFSFLDWSVGQGEITWPGGGFQNCGTPAAWATAVIVPGTTAIEQAKKPEMRVDIFPNPANDSMAIRIPNGTDAAVEIMNMDGSLNRSIDFVSPQSSIDVHDLSRGMYFLRIHNREGVRVKKFLKN